MHWGRARCGPLLGRRPGALPTQPGAGLAAGRAGCDEVTSRTPRAAQHGRTARQHSEVSRAMGPTTKHPQTKYTKRPQNETHQRILTIIMGRKIPSQKIPWHKRSPKKD